MSVGRRGALYLPLTTHILIYLTVINTMNLKRNVVFVTLGLITKKQLLKKLS